MSKTKIVKIRVPQGLTYDRFQQMVLSLGKSEEELSQIAIDLLWEKEQDSVKAHFRKIAGEAEMQ